MARIEVDRGACIGAGLCAWNAPEVFEQDEEGLSRVRADAGSGEGLDEGVLEEARAACPAQAIRLAQD